MERDLKILKEEKIIHGLVELRSDNILTFRPDIVSFKEYNLQIFKDLLEVFIDFTDGIPRPYMCDNSYITGIINKETKTFMNEHFDRFATHAAMITNSPVAKVLVGGYNLNFKPKVKIRTFSSEEDAVKWLLQD